MKIYLSGPMTGKPNNNYDLFNLAAKVLRKAGHEVANPAEVQIDSPSWPNFMREDIKLLMDCTDIFRLPGWNKSRGAVIEDFIGREIGMKSHGLITWLAFDPARCFVSRCGG